MKWHQDNFYSVLADKDLKPIERTVEYYHAPPSPQLYLDYSGSPNHYAIYYALVCFLHIILALTLTSCVTLRQFLSHLQIRLHSPIPTPKDFFSVNWDLQKSMLKTEESHFARHQSTSIDIHWDPGIFVRYLFQLCLLPNFTIRLYITICNNPTNHHIGRIYL